MKIKISELSRSTKSGLLPPISPTMGMGKQERDIDYKLGLMKKSKERQSSLSLGASKKYKKVRDLSALPSYNRELGTNSIMDLRRVNLTPKESTLRSFSRNDKISPLSKFSKSKKSFKFQEEAVKGLPLSPEDYGAQLQGRHSEKIFQQGPLGTKKQPIPQRMMKL